LPTINSEKEISLMIHPTHSPQFQASISHLGYDVCSHLVLIVDKGRGRKWENTLGMCPEAESAERGEKC
jgi:hypothetical protein